MLLSIILNIIPARGAIDIAASISARCLNYFQSCSVKSRNVNRGIKFHARVAHQTERPTLKVEDRGDLKQGNTDDIRTGNNERFMFQIPLGVIERGQ